MAPLLVNLLLSEARYINPSRPKGAVVRIEGQMYGEDVSVSIAQRELNLLFIKIACTRKLTTLPRVKCIHIEHSEFKSIRLLYFVNISLALVALSGFSLVSDFLPCCFPTV